MTLEPDKYNILGVTVSNMSEKEAARETVRLMEDPNPGTVFFLSAEGSLVCQTDDSAAAFVNGCDLVLPGDHHTRQALLQIAEIEDPAAETQEYFDSYLTETLKILDRKKADIYAVMDTENHLSSLQEYMLNKYPGINLFGTASQQDSEGEASRIVNDINACIPDIVTVCVDVERQVDFVSRYLSMMNTRLCVCVDSLNPMIEKKTGDVPGIFTKLHLEGLYHWFYSGHKLQDTIVGSIFKRRVQDKTAMDRQDPSGTEEDSSEV